MIATYKHRIAAILLMFAGLLMTGTALRADDATFTAQGPSTVSVGQTFQLTYVLNEEGSDIRLGEMNGVTILYGPSTQASSSYSWINGQAKTTRQYSYTFVARIDKEGDYTISPATITCKGNQLKSNALTITAIKDATSGSGSSSQGKSNGQSQQRAASGVQNDEIVIVQSLNKSSVYEGEGVILTTTIYTIADLNSISDVKYPALDDFLTQDLMEDGRLQFQLTQLNGVNYHAAVSGRQLLIPQKSGKIKIDPVDYEFVVKKRIRNGGGGFFGGFFDDVQLVKQRARSKAVELTVKPLPRPAGFSGGVGDFNLSVSVSPEEVETNSSLQVKVAVSGEGNLKILTLPKPQFHQDFDTYDPSVNNNITPTATGFKGTRTAEYLLVPRRDGDFEIPQISLTYFSLSQGKYVTKTQGPFTIHVKKGANDNQQTTTIQVGHGEAVRYIKDLRSLHVGNSTLREKDDFFLFSSLFWLVTLMPLALLIVLFVVYRKRLRDSANILAVRQRHAGKVARKRLKKAASFMKRGEREQFFDEVMRALWGYLSDKLSLPLASLTKDNAREEMTKHGIAESDIDEFIKLLDACEFARYAPAEISDKMEDIYERAVAAMKN